jgi:hypothetical protein
LTIAAPLRYPETLWKSCGCPPERHRAFCVE